MCLLENKYISHKWIEENGHEKWYDGYIDKIVQNSKVLKYSVRYYGGDSDEEIFMEFDELITDFKSGDLVILW